MSLRGHLALVSWLSVLLGLCPVAAGADRGDVVLLGNPERLVVYDQYQLRLSPEARRAIPAFAPLRLVRPEAVLDDRFTHTMLVTLGTDRFYLLMDEGGGLNPATQPTVLKGVTFLGDTIRVKRGGVLSLLSPDKRSRRLLAEGEILMREFRDRELFYVRSERDGIAYGWISLPQRQEEREWEFVRAPLVTTKEFPPAIVEGVRRRLLTVNALLDSVFTHLNARQGSHRPPPAWRLSAAESQIACELHPASLRSAFGETTTALAKDIQTVLLGRDISLTASPGLIILRVKDS